MPKTKALGFHQQNAPFLPPGDKHLFVIGINHYRHCTPLKNAVQDAKSILEMLVQRFDFEPSRTTFLYDEDATFSSIVNQLHHYTKAGALKADDSLLIYYSGHGLLDENSDGYWAPVDAKLDDYATLIPNSTIRDKIKNMKCRHVLLISDSCFSGSLIYRSADTKPVNLVAAELEQRKSRRVMSSGGQDESVSDGASDNSPFAAAILSELSHQTASALIVDDLFRAVQNITRSNAPQLPQYEPLFNAGDMGGRFVLHLKNPSAGSVYQEPAIRPAPKTHSAMRRMLYVFPAILVVLLMLKFYWPEKQVEEPSYKQDIAHLKPDVDTIANTPLTPPAEAAKKPPETASSYQTFSVDHPDKVLKSRLEAQLNHKIPQKTKKTITISFGNSGSIVLKDPELDTYNYGGGSLVMRVNKAKTVISEIKIDAVLSITGNPKTFVEEAINEDIRKKLSVQENQQIIVSKIAAYAKNIQ